MSVLKQLGQTPFRRLSVGSDGISNEELHPKAAEAFAVAEQALLDISDLASDSKELAADLRRVIKLVWGEKGLQALSLAGASKNESPAPKSTSPMEVAEPAMMSLQRTQGNHAAALELLERSGRATAVEVARMSLQPRDKQENFIAARHGLPAGTMGADLSDSAEAAKLANWALTGKR